jgi:hypothetical protein
VAIATSVSKQNLVGPHSVMRVSIEWRFEHANISLYSGLFGHLPFVPTWYVAFSLLATFGSVVLGALVASVSQIENVIRV